MSSKRLEQFPDVEAKLQKPTKVSAFEQQKAHAEAKRKREAAETAAVYEEFVKSFDRDDNDDHRGARERRPSPGRLERPGGFGAHAPFVGASGKRHFGRASAAGPGMKSGPGSLGPAPLTFGRKRTRDASSDRRERDEGRARLGFEDQEPLSVSKAFNSSDDDEEVVAAGRAEEKAVSRPTLRLANLPPGTSRAVIKALILPDLAVENVRIMPPSEPGSNDRKSVTAIVTLSQDTASNDIDAAVSALQNRYLGYGFYLSLHRHLSSAAMSSSLTSLTTSTRGSQPFGAKPAARGKSQGPRQMGAGRGFAPPSSYAPPGGPLNRSGILHVPVEPPKDIKQLRMIHKVLEGILEHGPEFEALLMTRPDVQKDDKWAWIWDARSEGGVWYRYRLWELVSGMTAKRGRAMFVPVFEDSHAWKIPEQPLPYEYQTGIEAFVSDSEYNSSDDDDFDDELNKAGEADMDEIFLNPMEKSKLTHLLARLPTAISRLRTGDIARITAFAITHANRGADEIVDLIISNIERPFSYTRANPGHKPGSEEKEQPGSRGQSPGPEERGTNEAQDTSPASLVGLYVISDILSSSSTSGVRHAWRYRQLFETALRSRKVFEGLGLLGEKLHWGRLRAEKWRRSIKLVLGLWEGWCVFPSEAHEALVDSFENPPTLRKEEKVADDSAKKGRWKTVDAATAKAADEPDAQSVLVQGRHTAPAAAADGSARAGNGGGQRMAGPAEDGETDASEYTDDEDLDLECLDEEDIDGEPILESGLTSLSLAEEEGRRIPAKIQLRPFAGLEKPAAAEAPSRKRARPVDMFAGSDSEGND